MHFASTLSVLPGFIVPQAWRCCSLAAWHAALLLTHAKLLVGKASELLWLSQVLDLGIAVDRVAEVESRLEAAIKEGADMLITSGELDRKDKTQGHAVSDRSCAGHLRLSPAKLLAP